MAKTAAPAAGSRRGDPALLNAMAEALNRLFNTECLRNLVMRAEGGWKSVSDVEIAVAQYVDWFNHRRLHGRSGSSRQRSSRPTTGPASARSTTLKHPSPPGPDPSNRVSTKPWAIQAY